MNLDQQPNNQFKIKVFKAILLIKIDLAIKPMEFQVVNSYKKLNKKFRDKNAK